MGLFDSYYDPQTYQAGGGLIDRLLSQLNTQGQYQPGTGFPQSPMDASAAMAPQGNAPIAVGDYQMPRIGFPQVDPAALPQMAQLAQGQLTPEQHAALPVSAKVQQEGVAPQFQQPQAPLPPQLQAPGSGMGDHLSAGLNSFAGNLHTGILGSVLSGVSGLVTGQRNDPTGIQQQNLRAQYQALIAAGVPAQKAVLAVINPEFAKTIIPTELGSDKFAFTTLPDGTVVRQNAKTGEVAPAYQGGTKPKFVQMKDGMGGDHPAFVSEANQTINGQPIAEYNKQQAATTGLGNTELSGKEYLASIPAAQRGTVQGMVEGTIPPPTSFALSKPYWQNMIAAAKNVDPTFDAANWSGRVAGIKDFSAGKSSEMVRSANQTLHHTGQLLDSMDALNNGSYPLINRIGNAAAEATGGGAQGAFRTNAHAVAEELSKVFKGNNLSDTEIKSWEQNLNENMSPEQQRTQVAKLRDLLQGSLQALEEKRLNSIGPVAAEKQGPLIKEEGQRVLTRIQDWISKGTGAAQGTTPGQTRTGVPWSVIQ